MPASVRPLLLALVPFAAACPEPSEVLPQDTSPVGCDLIHGALGVMQMEPESLDRQYPDTAPDAATATTSLAGPLDDGRWLAMYGNQALVSEDDGCNWAPAGGRVPAGGNWELLVHGGTAWAFDRLSGQVGISNDGGASWTPADAGEPFLGDVQVDSTGRLRGVQARGVVTSEDGGQTWTPGGTPPPAGGSAAAVFPGNLDVAAVAYSGGVARTQNGGQSWEDIGGELVEDGFIGHSLAFSADSAEILWAAGEEPEANTIRRTVDDGDNWSDVASSRSLDLDADAPIWAVPGSPTEAASAWGSADEGINLYRVLAGDKLLTAHTGSPYTHVNDVAFRPDGTWLVAIDGVK